MSKIWSKIKKICITFSQGKAEISKSSEINTSQSREMDGQNQKALAENQDSLTRRPVELHHIPIESTTQVSTGDPNFRISASPHLRSVNNSKITTKNNTFINKDVVLSTPPSNVIPVDTRYNHYISLENPVKSSVDNRFGNVESGATKKSAFGADSWEFRSETIDPALISNYRLSFFRNDGKDSDQNKNSQSNTAGNIKIKHNIRDIIHNYFSLDNNKLTDQLAKEKNNPKNTDHQFVALLNNDSINTEAKKTWPISRNISDNASSFINDINGDIQSNYNSGPKTVNTSKILIKCPYCSSGEFVKRGTRQKKREKVQLYICKTCGRTFTPFSLKGKHYPLNVILDAISYYNLGFSLEQVSAIMKKKQNIDIQPSTVANWYDEHKEICAYNRMRPFAVKEFSPHDVIETATLAHRQLYRFRYHRAKTKYIMEDDFKHYKFYPLKEFLDNVSGETPHQYFSEGERASEAPLKFSKTEMIVRNKENFATRIAKMILEGVKENKLRHESLQKFMIANDSVTVATEVPVYIRREDLQHMQTQLGFKLYKNPKSEILNSKQIQNSKSKIQSDLQEMTLDEIPKLITGHIDFLQIRNGSVHIMDYKSDAAKERPIEQLTLYALALSRLTGLRLFHFKCAWFDEKDYFEFFPLHAVYKPGRGRKKVYTKEGEYDINNNAGKMEKIRPIDQVKF